MKIALLLLTFLLPISLPAPQSPRGADNYPTTTSVTLAWDASASTVRGYRVYWKKESDSSYSSADAGNVTRVTISGLARKTSYRFFAVAYDQARIESVPSNEVVYRTPNR